jgi:hypothetical protein
VGGLVVLRDAVGAAVGDKVGAPVVDVGRGVGTGVGALVVFRVGASVVGVLVAFSVGVCVVGELVMFMVGNGVDNAVGVGGPVGVIVVGPWVGSGMLAGDLLPGALVGKSLLFGALVGKSLLFGALEVGKGVGALDVGRGVGATVTGGADVPLVLGSIVGPLVGAIVLFNEDGAELTDGAEESEYVFDLLLLLLLLLFLLFLAPPFPLLPPLPPLPPFPPLPLLPSEWSLPPLPSVKFDPPFPITKTFDPACPMLPSVTLKSSIMLNSSDSRPRAPFSLFPRPPAVSSSGSISRDLKVAGMSPDPFDRLATSRIPELVDPEFRRKSTRVASERVRNAPRESARM